MGFLFKVVAVMVLASPALAEGLCHRQYLVGMTDANSRECRLSKLFEGWLAANGYESDFHGEPQLTVRQEIESLGSGMPLPETPLRPAATVSIGYRISEDVTEQMASAYQADPGFFGSLDQVLATDGKVIVCETMSSGEQAFVAAGGILAFELGLSPGFYRSGYPDWFTQVTIDQSSCEAP